MNISLLHVRRELLALSGISLLGSLALLPPASSAAGAQTAGSAQKAPAFKLFAPRGGGFSVQMPGPPKASLQTSKAPDGAPIINHVYECSGKGYFAIGYQEYNAAQAKLRHLDNPAQLDGYIKLAARQNKTKNPRVRAIKLNGFIGSELTGQVPGLGFPSNVRERVIWTGRRLYTQVTIFGPAERARADKFFASLKLLKPQ